jgi:outer membrane receptor protein involved in Fe transport
MISDAPPRVDPVVIEAPRLPPSPADAAFSILVLDPKALETAPRLDDALSQIPGFSLYRRLSSLGANPTTEGVALRGIAGSAASRALVTLDGVPQNDPFGGWVIFNALPSETLGEVTAVRGAGAGPYGAGALTGVIALQSAPVRAGDWLIDVRGGGLGEGRGFGVGTVAAGPVRATFWAGGERSSGWDPIRAGRGAADDNLTLADWSAGGRFQMDLGRAAAALRIAAFEERQNAGLVGAASRERGGSVAFTAAAPPGEGELGWRAQAWVTASNLANSAVSVSANQAVATLSDNEYATPALGVGANGALRKILGDTTLEAGADARLEAGEDQETFSPVAGQLTKIRRAGGDAFVGGAYAEATRRWGSLLLTGDARADLWTTFNGHDLEGPIGGATTLDLTPPARGGLVPSGRLGARWDLSDQTWWRAAIYSGFRPPTLNELFRPFRQGNFATLNNTALVPERLYGAETGLGGGGRRLTWSFTGFYNRLVDPVTNVTLHQGPYTDPLAGFVPAGGAVLVRENVGAVNAYGLEGDASATLVSGLSAHLAGSWTHARVEGAGAAPQLTGLRPAETPDWVVTGGLDARLMGRLTLTVDGRYEGRRFVDDLNTLPLAPSTVVDARLDWRLSRSLSVYLAAENLFDVAVQQNETTAGLISYGPPRIVLLGLTLSGGPRASTPSPADDR